MKSFRRAFNYFKPDAWPLAGVGGLIAAGALLGLLKPWPLALLVDCVLGTRPAPGWLTALPGAANRAGLIAWLAALTFLLHLGQGALSALYTYLSIKIGLRGLTRVRIDVFEKLTRLSLRFYQGARAGDVIYRATWDTYAFQTGFQQGWITLAASAASLLMMMTVMAALNARLTLVALGIVPLLLLAVRRFSGPMSGRGRLAQQDDSRVTSSVHQQISALQIVQSYTREASETERFRGQTDAARRSRLAQHGAEVLYGLAIAGVFAAGTAVIVWLGAREALRGHLTVGELLIFVAYLAQLYEPLHQLSHVGATLSGAGAGMGRVFELLDSPEEISSEPTAVSVRRRGEPDGGRPGLVCRGEVRFSGVRFGYRPGQEVLRGVDLTIQAGESVALIGPSGAGKTTLLNLLPRFFDPVEGEVFLDGTDLRRLRLPDLRAQIALVLQEPVLLPATIAENIAYGRPGASREEIRAAARAAHAEEFIQRLPEGYDTLVGEGAGRLSAGEKQRVNLARAFLKDAPVLLLDEPTSALDRESETLVARGLQELARGRTTLLVAHRAATIRAVNRIVVLADGLVVETGSHEELLGRGGYYALTHGKGEVCD
jgi:ATP-binding cassette subfamily B protein